MQKDKFIWEEKYSVGVASIDTQHKKFFDLANEIARILGNNEQGLEFKNRLVTLLIEFGNYAFSHLDYEEGYFKKFGYKDREEHTLEHDRYRDKISHYLKRTHIEDTDVKVLAKELEEFSITWLENHIMRADKKYVQFFRENNIS